MKIFITGGAGYVGAALVKYLVDFHIGSEITVYDNFSSGHNGILIHQKLQNVKFVKADILDSRSLKKAMAGHDAVIHLAESKNLDRPHYLEQVNHWGTAEICYAVESLGIKNFVYLSTTKVYPYTLGEDIIENNFEESPINAYASSKLRGEEHVRRFFSKSDCNIHIVRASSIYGYSPSLSFDSYMNKLLIDANYFNRIQLFGTGFQQRSFVHIDNVVSAVVALAHGKIASQIHNLSDHTVSIIDLIDIFKEIYPDLEFIFTSHHLSLPHIRVKSSTQIASYALNKSDILDNLKSTKALLSI